MPPRSRDGGYLGGGEISPQSLTRRSVDCAMPPTYRQVRGGVRPEFGAGSKCVHATGRAIETCPFPSSPASERFRQPECREGQAATCTGMAREEAFQGPERMVSADTLGVPLESAIADDDRSRVNSLLPARSVFSPR